MDDRLRTRCPSARGHRDRYELVFVLLLLTFVLGAFVTDGRARLSTLLLYALLHAAALLVALRSSQLSGPLARAVRVLLAVGSVAVGVAALVAPNGATQGALACWVAVVVLTTIIVIVRRVLHHPAVTRQTVLGALSAYLLIRFFFSPVYTATARLGPPRSATRAAPSPSWRRCSGRSSW
jgi:hypothetical protein